MIDTSKETVVQVDRLTVRYGSRVAVDEVSFQVERGSVFALLGRNGAGKSSLFRCLAGLQRPASGGASLLGMDAWSERSRAMRRVGVVHEDPDASPTLPIERLVTFCSRVDPSWDAEAVRARLDGLKIGPKAIFGELSKGQKKLASLALALGHAPELVLLDDPTLGLDVAMRRALYEEIIGDLADRGTTILMTSHDLAGIEGIADHVGFMKDARLVSTARLASLKARFAGASALEEIFLSITGETDSEEEVA